jgi:hypothetical protein
MIAVHILVFFTHIVTLNSWHGSQRTVFLELVHDHLRKKDHDSYLSANDDFIFYVPLLVLLLQEQKDLKSVFYRV